MRRVAVFTLVGVAALVSLGGASGARSASRVVGGAGIQVQIAPWAVFIKQTAGGATVVCSGSILDPLHVLTAAHCVYDQGGTPAQPTALSVRAGISSFSAPLGGDAEQDRGVTSVRVHPGYVWATTAAPDDVAVLALSAPLDLAGPAVQAVALPTPGAAFPAQEAVAIAGFGRQFPNASPDGSLHSLQSTVDGQGRCGGLSNTVIPADDAVALCASSPTGSVCNGDSGAGLVTTTGARRLVGIASASPPGCAIGSPTVFTSVGAPEILRFIQGDDHPPSAPRQTAATDVRLFWPGALVVGTTLTCLSDGWDGQPTLAYAFVNSETGRVLAQGPRPTYVLSATDAGSTVFCSALASNDGGTAVLSTTSTRPIGVAPTLGIAPLAPVAAARGRTVPVRVVLRAKPGLSGKFGVCITPPARIGHRVCSSQRIDDGSYGGFPFTLRLKIKPTAPLGTARVAIDAVAGVSQARSTAFVRIAR